MTRRACLVPFLLSLTAAMLVAANPLVGTWNCIATDEQGQQSSWTLVMKEDGGKLSGTLSGDPGVFQLTDIQVAGKSFSFKVVIGDSTYTSDNKVDGNTITGKYSGPEASGTIKGTRQQ